MPQAVSTRLKELHPDGFWLYVDNSPKSLEVLTEVKWLEQAGMLEVSDLTADGGFADGVPLPRLLRNGDVMSGRRLRTFLQFLKELNQEFLEEEQERLRRSNHQTPRRGT